MPAAVVAAIISAAGTAASTMTAAKMQSGAARRAADTTTQAANYAADKQDEASKRNEQFLREQAQREWESQEATRRANYDQWVAREERLGSIAEQLGYGRRNIPAYVPSVNPGFVPPASGGPPSTTMPVPTDGGSQLTPEQIENDRRRRATEALGYGYGGRRPGEPWDPRVAPTMAPTTVPPPIPSAREAILRRRYPTGSVGAMVLARQRDPYAAGVR